MKQRLYALYDTNSENCFRRGHRAHHTLGILDYPIDKPRNKARNEAVQRAESVLANFWNELDQHVKTHCSSNLSEYWDEHWPRKEDIKMTTDWLEKEKGLGMNTTPFSFGDEKPQTTSKSSSSKKKNRKKKNKGNGSDNLQTDTPLAHDPPTPCNSDTEKPRIEISKDAWRIAEGSLFYAPESNDRISDIPWSGLLTVMKSPGFKSEKMFGSIWRFEPDEKAKNSGLDRSITFHEPHGRETKMTRIIARIIGRRLNKAYGLDLSRLAEE